MLSEQLLKANGASSLMLPTGFNFPNQNIFIHSYLYKNINWLHDK